MLGPVKNLPIFTAFAALIIDEATGVRRSLDRRLGALSHCFATSYFNVLLPAASVWLCRMATLPPAIVGIVLVGA
jgi:hypothetical protein